MNKPLLQKDISKNGTFYKFVGWFMKLQKIIATRAILLDFIEELIHEFDYLDKAHNLPDSFSKVANEWKGKYNLKAGIIKNSLSDLRTYESFMTSFPNWVIHQDKVWIKLNLEDEFTKKEMAEARADLKKIHNKKKKAEDFNEEKFKDLIIGNIMKSIGTTNLEDYMKIEQAYEVYKHIFFDKSLL